jgi:hypothetical protein
VGWPTEVGRKKKIIGAAQEAARWDWKAAEALLMAFGDGDIDNPKKMVAALLVADGLRCLRSIATFTDGLMEGLKRRA